MNSPALVLFAAALLAGPARSQAQPAPPPDSPEVHQRSSGLFGVLVDEQADQGDAADGVDAPSTPAPVDEPPAPPGQPPAVWRGVPRAAAEAPVPDLRLAAPASGQWVHTAQYGWVWIPYGGQYTAQGSYGDESPYQYVYYPSSGWCWLAAPWVWGWGVYPYFGVWGPGRFGWYRGLVRSGYGWGGYRGGGVGRGWSRGGGRAWSGAHAGARTGSRYGDHYSGHTSGQYGGHTSGHANGPYGRHTGGHYSGHTSGSAGGARVSSGAHFGGGRSGGGHGGGGRR